MLDKGLQRGVGGFRRGTEGGEHSGRLAGSSAQMLLMEELVGLAGLSWFFFFCSEGDVRRHHSHSHEGTWGAGSRQMEGSPGQQGARAQELRLGRDF